MNRLFLCLLFFFPLMLLAQAPVLTFDEFYQESYRYHYQFGRDNRSEEFKKISGSNVFWDFSNLNSYDFEAAYVSGYTILAQAKDAANNTPYEGEATNILFSSGSSLEWVDYLKTIQDTIFRIGQLERSFGQDSLGWYKWDTLNITYEQPEQLFYNNFQYAQTRIDSFQINYERIEGLVKSKTINTSYYEGYGQLLLPKGDTLKNVIKVRTAKQLTYHYKHAFRDTTIQTTFQTYHWYAKGYSGAVLTEQENRYYFHVPFSFHDGSHYHPYEPNILVDSCNATAKVFIVTDEVTNYCKQGGVTRTIEIDLFADGEIDSTGNFDDNNFQYSFPVGGHIYRVIVKNNCGNEISSTYPVNIQKETLIEAICQETIVATAVTRQTDDTHVATLAAKIVDDGSFNTCRPSDALTFRLYEPNLVKDFYPKEESSIEEIRNLLPATLNFTCDFLQQPLYVKLYAIHANGSWGTCMSEIKVVDSLGYCLMDTDWVKLCVTQPDGTPVSKVIIDWNKEASLVTETVYQKGCVYTKPNVNRTINLIKVDEANLGVSTIDLILIQKHILGIAPFENEAQLLAADVNNTRTITVKDLLDLQKIILGKTNFFPGNTSWRFFPKHWLEEGFDWKNLNIGHHLRFDPKFFVDDSYEFIAIKVGDVSGALPK